MINISSAEGISGMIASCSEMLTSIGFVVPEEYRIRLQEYLVAGIRILSSSADASSIIGKKRQVNQDEFNRKIREILPGEESTDGLLVSIFTIASTILKLQQEADLVKARQEPPPVREKHSEAVDFLSKFDTPLGKVSRLKDGLSIGSEQSDQPKRLRKRCNKSSDSLDCTSEESETHGEKRSKRSQSPYVRS